MRKYDFDTEIDRLHTHASKWSFVQDEDDPLEQIATDIFSGEDRVLPMWVADMDFACPQPVIDALVARAQHGLFGYTAITDSFYQSAVNWMKKRHQWEIEADWICTSPGVVPALKAAVRAFVPPGDKVLIQTPVYYPFFATIEDNGAEIAANPLIYENGRYSMDFKDLEQKASDPQVKMAILCSPHNPIGRVWTREELLRFGDICLANDVLVVSDELHGDLIFNKAVFTPFAALGQQFAQNSIICHAPSKTFNMASIRASNIIIPNPQLREIFNKTMDTSGLGSLNLFATIALEAAYNHGEEWLEQLLVYIQGNFDFMCRYLAENIPQITVVPLEGTYLAWLDCRSLGLDKKALRNLMLDKARVYLDEGYIFGAGGEGFERINLACPRSILAEALLRINNAVDQLTANP
jgi:cystathionine beta-lyase